MKIAQFPLGEWLPDAPDFGNPGLVRAHNVFPSAGGYRPFPNIASTGDSAAAAVRGARLFKKGDDTGLMAGGTASDLFIRTSSGVTASSLALTLASDAYWQFERFADYIFAVAPGQSMYYLDDIDTDTTWSAAPGSPPKALAIGRVGDFLVLGNLTDIDSTTQPYRIRWSAFNDPTANWVTDRGKQSGFVDMPRALGEVTGIAGTRYPMVFQKYGVSRIAYVGGTTAFAKEVISDDRGCIAPPSIVEVGSVVYFLSDDGFKVANGASVQDISSKRVAEWFLDDVDGEEIVRTQGAVDWSRQAVIWSYYPSGESAFNKQIIYSWRENRWSTAELGVEWLVSSEVDGTTLEELDALFPSGLETVDPPLDSDYWKARDRRFGAWADTGTLYTFTGSPLKATLETGEFQPAAGKRVFINGVAPLVENEDQNTQVRVGTRGGYKGGTVSYSDLRTVERTGIAPFRADGRYARAEVTIPAAAEWDKASAVQVHYRVSGGR